MSQERKRVEKAPIPKVIPKKREEPKLEEKPIEVTPIVVEKPKPKAKVKPIEVIQEVIPIVIEKQKTKPKPIPKLEPKKRGEIKEVEVKKQKLIIKPQIKEEDLINPEIAMVEYKRVRSKPSDDKYVRYASSEYLTNKLIISEKVQKNEMKFAYFAIDGDDFYHYYILTK